MRIGGPNCPELKIPEELGNIGTLLYQKSDLLCRKLAKGAMKELGLSPGMVDEILDPVMKDGSVIREGDTTVTEFLPEGNFVSKVVNSLGYISSSILDNFYYYNTFDKKSLV